MREQAVGHFMLVILGTFLLLLAFLTVKEIRDVETVVARCKSDGGTLVKYWGEREWTCIKGESDD